MKWSSRLMLSAAMTLLVLSSACNLPAQPPAIPTTALAVTAQETSTPSPIPTLSATPAAAIPITGMDVVSLQCQFCVNDEPHAVLIMSSQAFFTVEEPNSGVTCLSAREINGRRILLCRGAQQASFTLNVCVDNANCLQFPITLQPCPLIPQTGVGTVMPTSTLLTPVILTPRNTLIPRTGIPPTATSTIAPPTAAPTDTGVVTPLPTTATEPPPEPTSTPEPPTVEPPPPTSGSGGAGDGLVICHVSQGNSNDRSTITVSPSSWQNVHSQHGDSPGAC